MFGFNNINMFLSRIVMSHFHEMGRLKQFGLDKNNTLRMRSNYSLQYSMHFYVE